MVEKEKRKMRKKDLYIVGDIETANFAEDALAYDVGLAIIDRQGNVYDRKSFIVSEIFNGQPDLMQSAYYAHKIPEYFADIERGGREVVTFYKVVALLKEWNTKYKPKAFLAYNAFFDMSGLNRTQRYITKSKYRYALPYGLQVQCIWHMACQTICSQKKYYDFCIKNGFVSKAGNISTSAETVYRFLIGNPTFQEAHKGLEDVEIEAQIFAECIKKHKKMSRKINRACWRLAQRKEG
jgi:hypothetical protein